MIVLCVEASGVVRRMLLDFWRLKDLRSPIRLAMNRGRHETSHRAAPTGSLNLPYLPPTFCMFLIALSRWPWCTGSFVAGRSLMASRRAACMKCTSPRQRWGEGGSMESDIDYGRVSSSSTQHQSFSDPYGLGNPRSEIKFAAYIESLGSGITAPGCSRLSGGS